jgi:hypothetical protein
MSLHKPPGILIFPQMYLPVQQMCCSIVSGREFFLKVNAGGRMLIWAVINIAGFLNWQPGSQQGLFALMGFGSDNVSG